MMSNGNFQRRILIIDDNPAIHEDFRKTLCKPNAAPAALEALEDSIFGQTDAPAPSPAPLHHSRRPSG